MQSHPRVATARRTQAPPHDPPLVALGEGVAVAVGVAVGAGGVRVGCFVADAVGLAVVWVGFGVTVFLVGATEACGAVVACVLAVDAALGDWVGFCSGATDAAAVLLGVGRPLAVGSGVAEVGSGDDDVGDGAAVPAGLAAAAEPEPMATATIPVATTATAVLPAVRASTSRTARSRRRPPE